MAIQTNHSTKQRLVKHQFLRFLIVGIMNSLFGYGCFAVLLYLGLHYAQALFIATLVGLMFNFKSTGSLVFKSQNNRLILRFIVVYSIVYSLNVLGIKAFFHFGVAPYFSGALLILPMAVLAFFLNKRFVFNYG